MNKKILYINDYFIGGGAEKVFVDTYQLMEKYYDVDVFYATEKTTKPNNAIEYIYSNNYYHRLHDKLIKFQPDVIHIHNYYHKLSPSILDAIKEYKKDSLTKVCFTAHDFHLLAPNSGYTFFSWFNNKVKMVEKPVNTIELIFRKWDHRGTLYSLLKQIQWIFNYKLKHLDKVIDIYITPSNFLSSLFQKKYEKPVYTIRNPIAFKAKNINSNKHLSQKKKLIFIGRLSSEKGLLKFLLEFKDMFFQNDLIFNIVGNGAEFNSIRHFIESNKLEGKVYLLGKKTHEETLKYLEDSHCLVLPSICYENAPLSLVEGAVFKNKLLTMDYGGMKEIAQICGNYMFINHKKDELLNFINNKGFIDNQEDILKTFSLSNYVQKLCDIYD